ncbi:unnamed protein product [Caenorhabditis angaria]|uniref:CUB-like domain-containing protein n=1 Tax=Caenorhabditis angaria TaxID=860376 RepID=A0A9P1N1P1_9PELO|nr:unnamed protein product [Caenorhabditis angaria]
MLFIFFFFAFFTSVYSESYVCNGTNTIQAPANLSQVLNFPNTWNISQTIVPNYAQNQDCRWDIEVPQGYYANLLISSVTKTPSWVRVIYSNGYVDEIYVIVNGPYMFVSPTFTVLLHAAAGYSGGLAFEVTYVPIPTFNPINYGVSKTDPQIIKNITSCVITAPTQVSLIASATNPLEFFNNLRKFVVYDGPDANSPFIGTLEQVLFSDKQLVSSGNQMTVTNLIPSLPYLDNFIVVQDYSSVKQFTRFRITTCTGTNDCFCELDATNGTAAVVAVSKSDQYLKSLSIAPTSNLTVYYGSIQNSNIVKTFKANDTGFPQKLNNYITTISLDSNIATVVFSYDSPNENWNTVTDKRTGYVSSPNYGIDSVDQSVNETFTGNDVYNYTTKVISNGLVGKATLQITTYDKFNNIIDDHNYTSNSIPTSIEDVHPGKTLSIIYQSNGEKTNGVLIDFSVLKTGSNSCAIQFVWAVFLVKLVISFIDF